MVDTVKFYQDQNHFLGCQLAELTQAYEKEKESILKAMQINAYKIKIARLENGERLD